MGQLSPVTTGGSLWSEMEVVSSNDGLLTNIEVLEILKENRSRRGNGDGAKIDLQNRENVEIKA
jgi:hypothetical protein